MITRIQSISLFVLLSLNLTSCINPSPRIGYDQLIDITWKALQPNTTSGNPDNWEVGEARRVIGREVVNEFVEARFINCPGPLPPENKAIKASSEYWYIRVVPASATVVPEGTETSQIDPTQSPEPLISEVLMLIDAYSGQVVARKFTCRVY